MAGVGEKCFRRRGFEDFPFVHEDDAVGDGAREAHFVRDHQHGDAAVFRQFDHHVQHFFDHFRVERRGRFVEEQYFAVHAQGAGDGDTLLLSAGELAGVFVRLFADTDAFEVLPRRRFRLGARLFVHPDRAEGEVVEDSEVREEVELLEDHADFAPEIARLFGAAGEEFTVQADFAFLVVFQAVDAADQRRFARTGRAADDEALAFFHVQVDVFQGMVFAVPLVEVVDVDGVCHGRSGVKWRSMR